MLKLFPIKVSGTLRNGKLCAGSKSIHKRKGNQQSRPLPTNFETPTQNKVYKGNMSGRNKAVDEGVEEQLKSG